MNPEPDKKKPGSLAGQTGISCKRWTRTKIQNIYNLMQNLFNDRAATTNKIFDAGIFHFSQKLPVEMHLVIHQLLYDYYRHKDKLTPYLRNELTSHYKDGSLEYDDDYNGFYAGNEGMFIPMESDQLRVIMENDPEFLQAAKEYQQLHAALKTLGISCNTGRQIMAGKKLLENIPDREPWPMVNINLLFQYYKEEKTSWQLAQFAAYIAIRSILGKKSYCKTNKQMILARIFGYKTLRQLQESKLTPSTKELVIKYSNRYWMDRLLKTLETDWNILIYSFKGSYGLYIGIENKINMDSFIMAIESKRESRKLAYLKQRKEEARNKAIQHINKEQHINKG